jgi:hypothetical protein
MPQFGCQAGLRVVVVVVGVVVHVEQFHRHGRVVPSAAMHGREGTATVADGGARLCVHLQILLRDGVFGQRRWPWPCVCVCVCVCV